ncbi:MAG: glycosyltransferase family 4 protein [Bacteroidetes bacterium]|nr:glycosyltransferase family 4 protein [Bacteroidota bacterium]
MKKLAVVATHPVQYHVPWLVRLGERDIHVKVFYTWEQSKNGIVFDSGFGKSIQWDIPLLEGYDHEFVTNTSRWPGLHHFKGLVNPDLISKIEEWGAEGVLVIGWNYHSHLRCMRHFHGKIPVYFRGDSVLLHEKPGPKKWARRLFLTWVYRHIDYALYVGRNNKAYFIRHGMKPSQLIFSPQAIDIDRFSQPNTFYTQGAQQRKAELGIPSNHLTVLFAGKMQPVKNPFYMAELARACQDLPVHFILVGDGKLKRYVEQRCQGMPNVTFMDFQNQRTMPIIYRMGDVYIMPSVSETWGMGINEAMACERPVIATDRVGCAADLVLEGITGITIERDDLKKSVAFIREMCGDRQRLEEMGHAARALIQLFSFTQVIDSIALAMKSAKKYRLRHVHRSDRKQDKAQIA